MESSVLSLTNDNHRRQLLFWAVFSLLLGFGFLFFRFVIFGYLSMLLPWALCLVGAGLIFNGIPRKSKRRYIKIAAGILIAALGGVLFYWARWRDSVLWYIFVLYLLISAYNNMRPAWLPGVEKHVFARCAGGLTVWGFAALLLLMPRSGLSDALQLFGIFSAAWGMYQILLPPGRE